MNVTPTSVTANVNGTTKPLRPNGRSGWSGEGVEVRIEGHRITLEGSEQPIESLEITWSMQIGVGAIILGDAWERSYGDLGWRELDSAVWHPWYAAWSVEGRTSAIGVKTGCHAMARWNFTTTSATLRLDVRSGNRPLILKVRSLQLCEVVYHEGVAGHGAFETVRAFVKTLCPNRKKTATPIYGVNDWYYAYGHNTAGVLVEDSHRAGDLTAGLTNRPFSVIDMGWERDGADWSQGNSNFPDMPGLAAKIKAAGCRPGLWMRPLLTKDPLPKSLFMAEHTLDPSLPEVLAKVEADVFRIHGWGYELIKHDFTTYDICGLWGFEMKDGVTGHDRTFHDQTRTTAEILLDLYSTIRRSAGSTIVLGCNTVGHLSAGIFEAQRIGDDTSGQEWARTRKMGVNTLAFRGVQHDAFFAADPDCVGLTTKIPWKLNEQWLELVAFSGTPLFVSAEAAAVGPEQTAALKKAFAAASRAQPLAEPLDWVTEVTPTEWKLDGKSLTFDWAE